MAVAIGKIDVFDSSETWKCYKEELERFSLQLDVSDEMEEANVENVTIDLGDPPNHRAADDARVGAGADDSEGGARAKGGARGAVRHSIFQRQMQTAMHHLHIFNQRESTEAKQNELLRSLPNFLGGHHPEAATANPPAVDSRNVRDIRRCQTDRRRPIDVKAIVRALNKPSYLSTNRLNLADLKAKGLGRPNDIHVSLKIEWVEDDICGFIHQRYPVLAEVDFTVMMGKQGNKLAAVPTLTKEAIKDQKVGRVAPLWILPTIEITHYTMGTPTVTARTGPRLVEAEETVEEVTRQNTTDNLA